MFDSQDRRHEPRHKVDVPNAVRIVTPEGDCLADLVDVGSTGLGFRYYDFFGVLSLLEGRNVRLKWLVDPQTGYCIKIPSFAPSSTENGMEQCENPPIEDVEARVIWTYLNRVGLELLGESREEVCEHLMKRCKGSKR